MARAQQFTSDLPPVSEPPTYGGRALSQGVLMVGPHSMAVAVRRDDGEIDTAVEAFHMPFTWARQIPFLRGMMAMGGAVILAIRSNRLERRLGSKGSGDRLKMLKAALPIVAVSSAERILTRALIRKNVPGARMEVFRLLMPFVAFRMSTVFGPSNELLQYHGAEHMAVNTVEAGRPLTAPNAAVQSRIHPRCGTTFAFWALLLGWLAQKIPGLRGTIRSALVGPLVIATAYEILKFGAAHKDDSWAQLVFTPAWQMQRLTTATPTTAQLEVACAALQAVLDFEGAAPGGSSAA
ncbi:MAG TPA: DUF1385 domain-containing protein [Chloroflexota bacterium]|nr:DUF1385 domain-containing protein [Chloroflexota bacterium]